MAIPVYMFLGFLESGKTTLIQETLNDEGFNEGEKTLLLVFEDGIEDIDALVQSFQFGLRRNGLATQYHIIDIQL